MFAVEQLHFGTVPESQFCDNSQTQRVSKCPFTRLTQSLSQIDATNPGVKMMSVVSWIRDFIAKPNSSLGRQGAVCPFMARTLNSGSIYFKSIDVDSEAVVRLDDLIKEQSEIFLTTEPTQGKARLNKAIVLVFPDVTQSNARELIEETQARLKPFFVERGLMLGEFHQDHQGEGIHNKAFRPLQSPVPLLIIRHLIPSDLIFLNRSSDSAARRVHFLRSYLTLFQNTLPSRFLSQALASYDKALAEMSL